MTKPPYSIETLREKILFYIGCACVVLAIIGIYSARQIVSFRESARMLEEESAQLVTEVKKDLSAMALLGRLNSDLKTYLLAPSDRRMAMIKSRLAELRQVISSRYGSQIEELERRIDLLDLRMKSLIQNQKSAHKAQDVVLAQLVRIASTCRGSGCGEMVAWLQSHLETFREDGFYAVSGHDDHALRNTRARQTLADMIEFLAANQSLFQSDPESLELMLGALADADDALESIGLIRQKAEQSKAELDTILQSFSDSIYEAAQSSIDQNENRIVREFQLIQEAGLVMILGLAATGLILILFGVFLVGKLLAPIQRLGDTLIRLSRFLVDLRNVRCNLQDYRSTLDSMPVRRRDEIGHLARSLKELVVRIYDLSTFRRTIEADETVEVIYSRLGRIFEEQLKLTEYSIKEIDEKSNALKTVQASPKELWGLCDHSASETCRALRTASPVNSLEAKDVCAASAYGQDRRHVCIPMIVSGKAMGVISFILDEERLLEEGPDLVEERIHQASSFINEAMPILQAKKYATTLKNMAMLDELTGLYNRRYLEETIDTLVAGVLRRQTSLGILMCDMDYFKQVNDHYGHDAGDEVLRQLSEILKGSIRSSDIAIRYGGEEFLILLMDVAPDKVKDVAEKIRKKVEGHYFRAMGKSLRKTISIGVSIFPGDDNLAIWEAIKFADVALYRAKESGRNTVVVFDNTMWESQTQY